MKLYSGLETLPLQVVVRNSMARTNQTAKRSTGGKAPRKDLATKASQSGKRGITAKEFKEQTARRKLEFNKYLEVPEATKRLAETLQERARAKDHPTFEVQNSEATKVELVDKYRDILAGRKQASTTQKSGSKRSGKTPKKLFTTIGTPVKPLVADSDKKPAAKRAMTSPKKGTAKRSSPKKKTTSAKVAVPHSDKKPAATTRSAQRTASASPVKNPPLKKQRTMDKAKSKKDSSSKPPGAASKSGRGGSGKQGRALPLHKNPPVEHDDDSPSHPVLPIPRKVLPPAETSSLVKSIDVAKEDAKENEAEKPSLPPSPSKGDSVVPEKEADTSAQEFTKSAGSKESVDQLEEKVVEEGEGSPEATDDQDKSVTVPGRVTPPIGDATEKVVNLEFKDEDNKAVAPSTSSPTTEVKAAEDTVDAEVPADASEQDPVSHNLKDLEEVSAELPVEASQEGDSSLDKDDSNAETQLTPTPDTQHGLTEAAVLPEENDDTSKVKGVSGDSLPSGVKATEDEEVAANLPPATPQEDYTTMGYDEYKADTQLASNLSRVKSLIETEDELKLRLLKALDDNVDEFQAYVKEVIPNIKYLSPEAIRFFTSIFGGDDLLPARNAVEDLVAFLSIGTSPKVGVFAHQKMRDETFQFQLRYFAGVKKGNESPDAIKEGDYIKGFFNSIFNEPEREHINQCVDCARSLYITAKTMKYTQKAPPGEPRHFSEVENIICCINFALIGTNRGFFVNWLATSKEYPIRTETYGNDFSPILPLDKSWFRKSFATFLMKAVHYAVATHLQLSRQLYASKYNIVLQARVAPEERSGKFYHDINFDEVGFLLSETDLNEYVFPGFFNIMDTAKTSNSDYIHFIWNGEEEDIAVFKNTSGRLGKSNRPKHRLEKIKSYSPIEKTYKGYCLQFPFLIQRKNIFLLATELEFFFLPFKVEAELDAFITASQSYNDGHAVWISETEKAIMAKATGWVNSHSINFYINW